MPMFLDVFMRRKDEERQHRKQAIETRTVVATCQVGNHPIHANSLDGKDYEMLNDKPICFQHFYSQEPEIEYAGRGSPHGGCVADPSN